MKIPKRLKIGGHYVQVKNCRDIVSDDGRVKYLGKSFTSENLIVLAHEYDGRELPKSTVDETFLHEIVHVVETNAGLNLKEGQVNALASGLYQVLKDNKLSFT